jgi:transcriptional regulator with XRE-family HTH domain
MDSFGETLKSEREDRGLTIEAVSEMLAVDQDLLRALERNDFDSLPDDGTMLWMLQGYARCLDVDAEMMIDDYVKEHEKCLERLADKVAGQAVEEPDTGEAERVVEEASTEREAAVDNALTRLETEIEAHSAVAEMEAAVVEERPVEADERPAVAEVAPAIAEPPAGVLPEPTPAIREGQPPLAALIAVCVVLAAGAVFTAWYMFSGEGTAPTRQSPAAEVAAVAETAVVDASDATAAATARPTTPGGRVDAVPTPSNRATRRRAATSPALPTLGIPEFGVGTGIEDRQLVGQRTDFAEGSKVWFWNHVEGGSAGNRIEHVWLKDGEVALRVSLKLGGSRWRTYSNKAMHAGAAGKWAVEARDSNGHVLARSEFSCTP